MKILLETEIDRSYSEVYAGFTFDLFKYLKPPLIGLEIPRFDGCKTGDEVHLVIKLGPIKQEWVSHITDHGFTDEEGFFIDEGFKLPVPLKYWKHRHRVIKKSDNECLIVDDITYNCGNSILDVLVYPAMYVQFWLRKPMYKKYFK